MASDSKSYRRDFKKEKKAGSAQILDRSPPFDLDAEMGCWEAFCSTRCLQ